MNDKKIWITSDTHFCHDRDFLYKPRGFNSVAEMNKAIVENWNSVVSWEDEVYLLGDVILNDTYTGIRLLNQLAGKIYIITGNHDTTNKIQEYVNIRPTILHIGLAYILRYKHYKFYLSHYPTICGNFDNDKPLKTRLINLCGHSHTKDKFADIDKGLIYHCELDAHNNMPILIDDIIEDLKMKIATERK